MDQALLAKLSDCLSQSEAGALAVIASHLRNKVEDEPEVYKDSAELIVALAAIEDAAICSISANDGNVVKWVGYAAKQMTRSSPNSRQ